MDTHTTVVQTRRCIGSVAGFVVVKGNDGHGRLVVLDFVPFSLQEGEGI